MKAGRTPWTVNMSEWKIIDADGNDVCQIRGRGEQHRKGNAQIIQAMNDALRLVEALNENQEMLSPALSALIKEILKIKNGEA